MALNDQSRLNAGHGLKNLSHPLHSLNDVSTSRWRRNRSSANLLGQVVNSGTTLANPQTNKPLPKLERSPSKMSLFNLFSKPKVEKARGHSEVGLAVPMQPQKPTPAPTPAPKSALRLNPSPQAQQVQRVRNSAMLKPSGFMASGGKRTLAHFEPPPLFQAYPQAVKHATVQSCIFSPDVLLRTQSQRKQYNLLRERMDSHRDLSATLSNEANKLEKSHKRLTSTTSPELTNKVFVLVTSGYVLQYAGDGPFDRLPEKVLQLGKESAAFACDLIPGKHWVLQVSQSTNEDGSVMAPKNSLLSRLRLPNSNTKKAATSFLLVMENAEEMDSWMTAVRKQIDIASGARTRESIAKDSIDETPEKTPGENVGSRYPGQHDVNRISKAAPVDSPMQSLDSPRIVTTDWEAERSDKTASVSDSSSLHSSKNGSKRLSVEAPSIITSAPSIEQLQLDQLRERNRHSYMSNATSASGTLTRNTSRNSSPAPNSPHKESFSTAESEAAPRSATSLRSFHMNPNTATANRRRSMQPLPTTNEDQSLAASSPAPAPQRHSIYGPTAPALRRPDQELNVPTSAYSRPTNPRFSHAPMRSSARSSSAPPPRNGTISPPPRDPAPPPAARPLSTLGSLPTAGTYNSRPGSRLSQGAKPFLRPIPVRPQNAENSVVVPRRFSSLAPAPAPLPLGIVVNRSVTAPITSIAAPTSAPREEVKATPPVQSLRRPTSMQIRSDPAPFLSSSRPTTAAPARAISSTPSFVPGRRASTTPSLHQSPSIPVLRQQAQRAVAPRKSMPVIGLPPPAPPPDMPLPPPPPVSARPVVV